MKLTFLGATGTVTGSKYLIEDGTQKILVDCGLFQGLKDLRLKNWESLPIKTNEIDAILLTHAHLDHSGYIPLLVKNGFKGTIYCSEATLDLCKILLPDSGHIQESDAERANRYGYSKHKPAKPLYNQEDAHTALQQFKAVGFGKDYKIGDFLTFNLSRAGHILGASSIKVSDGQTSILFSGDLGRPNDPIMKPPVGNQKADYLVLESTYGNRLHDDIDPLQKLCDVIKRTTKRGGHIIIPSFAVGRAQLLLYYLHELKQKHLIPDIRIYLDSPMAVNATQQWKVHHAEHRLSPKQCDDICQMVHYVGSTEESRALNDNPVPTIIISASGMATGGRVLHHMVNKIGDHRNTILFAGYQAAGTRGARLVHGEKEIKIHGQLMPVNAEIENLDSLSAHSDYNETLGWLESFSEQPRKVFLTHGEAEASSALKFKIEERLKWQVEIPTYLQQVDL